MDNPDKLATKCVGHHYFNFFTYKHGFDERMYSLR